MNDTCSSIATWCSPLTFVKIEISLPLYSCITCKLCSTLWKLQFDKSRTFSPLIAIVNYFKIAHEATPDVMLCSITGPTAFFSLKSSPQFFQLKGIVINGESFIGIGYVWYIIFAVNSVMKIKTKWFHFVLIISVQWCLQQDHNITDTMSSLFSRLIVRLDDGMTARFEDEDDFIIELQFNNHKGHFDLYIQYWLMDSLVVLFQTTTSSAFNGCNWPHPSTLLVETTWCSWTSWGTIPWNGFTRLLRGFEPFCGSFYTGSYLLLRLARDSS